MKTFLKYNWKNLLKLLGLTIFWVMGFLDVMGYFIQQLGNNPTENEWEMAFNGLLMFVVMQLTYYIVKYIKKVIITSKSAYRIEELK